MHYDKNKFMAFFLIFKLYHENNLPFDSCFIFLHFLTYKDKKNEN